MTLEALTQGQALEQMANGISTKAVNEDTRSGVLFERFDRKLKGEEPVTADDLLAALIGGANAGSMAVARLWAESHPASAFVYWAGAENVLNALEAGSFARGSDAA